MPAGAALIRPVGLGKCRVVVGVEVEVRAATGWTWLGLAGVSGA